MAQGRTVTILFTDLVSSTEMLAQLGDEKMERVRQLHFRLLREAVAASGGEEVKSLGDGLMVIFPSALDAIGCAVAMQQAVHLHNQEHPQQCLRVRVGLHSGEPIEDEGDYFGTPVVVARRLCDQAQGGQILVSDLTRALVGSRGNFSFRDLGELPIKGLPSSLPTKEVVWGDRTAEGANELLVRSAPHGAGGRRRFAPIVFVVLATLAALALIMLNRERPEERAVPPSPVPEDDRQRRSLDAGALVGMWLCPSEDPAAPGYTSYSFNEDGTGLRDGRSREDRWADRFRWETEDDLLRCRTENETLEFRIRDLTPTMLHVVRLGGEREELRMDRLRDRELIRSLLLGAWQETEGLHGEPLPRRRTFRRDGGGVDEERSPDGETSAEFRWRLDGDRAYVERRGEANVLHIRHISPGLLCVIGAEGPLEGEEIILAKVEERGDTRTRLLGTWREGVEHEGVQGHCDRTFHEDGSGREEGRLGEHRWEHEFRWSVQGDRLHLETEDGPTELRIRHTSPTDVELIGIGGHLDGRHIVMTRMARGVPAPPEE